MSTLTSNPIAAALRELIRLKDLKTDANINTSGDWDATRRRRAMLEEHDAKKGEAWDAARRALYAFDSGSSETREQLAKRLIREMATETEELLSIVRDISTMPAHEPFEPHFEMRGKCECGLAWHVGSGFAFEVKEMFCTCGRKVPVNRAAVQGASRDASPADLVGALQDVVHTDPGPVRAGKSVRQGEPGASIAGFPVVVDPTMPPDQIELRKDGNCPTGDWPHNFATETTERMTKGRCIYCGTPAQRT